MTSLGGPTGNIGGRKMSDKDRRHIEIQADEPDSLPPAEQPQAEESADSLPQAEAPEAPGDAVARLEQELANEHERYLRAVAELQNFRRRAAEERIQQLQFANETLLADLLPVLDNFERALSHHAETEADEALLQGVRMILGQFRDVFTKFGVAPIPTENQAFDPSLHEAVERVETKEAREGTIIEETLKGYTLNGRVLRAAKVKVAVSPGQEGEG